MTQWPNLASDLFLQLSHSHLFMYYQWLLLCCKAELSGYDRDPVVHSLKYFDYLILQKMFAQPCPKTSCPPRCYNQTCCYPGCSGTFTMRSRWCGGLQAAWLLWPGAEFSLETSWGGKGLGDFPYFDVEAAQQGEPGPCSQVCSL